MVIVDGEPDEKQKSTVMNDDLYERVNDELDHKAVVNSDFGLS